MDVNYELGPESVASTITSHTSGWASFFSSCSLMVKPLGYGSASVEFNVMFKANAKRTKNRIVSSVSLLTASEIGGKRESVVAAAAANLTAKSLSSTAPTPKKGNSETSTPALGPPPSTSVSNKQSFYVTLHIDFD